MKAEPTTKQLIEMLYERLPELFDRPAREWVGLTDEELQDIETQTWGAAFLRPQSARQYARAIKAKLKEKNS